MTQPTHPPGSSQRVGRRRRTAWVRDYEWAFLGVLALLAVVLGTIGLRQAGTDWSWLDALYVSLQLFTLQGGTVEGATPLALDVARFMAPAVTVWATTKALAALFRARAQLLRVRLMSGHVVVAGLGGMGWILVRAFQDRGYRVVAVERDPQNSRIDECRELGIPVFVGDASDAEVLVAAGVLRAAHLVSVCGQDEANTEIAAAARDAVVGRRDDPLNCVVHVIDPRLAGLLREREVALRRADAFRLEFFNVYEGAGREWLDAYPPFDFRPGAGDPARPPHLVIVGFGSMGWNLLVGAARRWLTVHPDADPRLRVTVVSRDAARRREVLCMAHPHIEEVCDVRAVTLDVDEPEFGHATFLLDAEGRPDATAVYVCLDSPVANIAAALTILRTLRLTPVPIVVRTAEAVGMSRLLTDVDQVGSEFEHLHAFPVLEWACRPEVLFGMTETEVMAKAIHSFYVEQAAASGQTRETNPSVRPWQELPEELKESNRRQANHILVKLEAIGRDLAPSADGVAAAALSAEEIEYLAEMEHNRWMAERRFEGWTYAEGPKDIKRRTTPDMLPWAELPDNVKEIDRVFIRGIPTFLSKTGYSLAAFPSNGKGT